MHSDRVFLHFVCITTIACVFLLLYLLGKNLNVNRNPQVTSRDYIPEMLQQGSNQSVALLDPNPLCTLGVTCQSQVVRNKRGTVRIKEKINRAKQTDASLPLDS